MAENNLLAVDELSLKLGQERILQDISLTVNKGEVYALIGANGSGKSSLAASIMGLKNYSLDSGEIYFKGEAINQLPIHKRAKRGITLSWQEPARFEGVSVRKFLGLGLESRGKKVTKEQLDASLRKVAINPEKYLNRNVDDTLSGGERKRIELASLLLLEPELVILDEPDSGIDVVALKSISQVVDELKEKKVGVLLITHSDEMLKLADKAALICQGQILDRGNPERVSNLFKNECDPCSDKAECLVEEENYAE